MPPEHKHAPKDLSINPVCKCGVELCGEISRGGRVCTLERGHAGPHHNDHVPDTGTW